MLLYTAGPWWLCGVAVSPGGYRYRLGVYRAAVGIAALFSIMGPAIDAHPPLVVQVPGLPLFVLDEFHQRRRRCLEQRMPAHHRQELLQPLSSALDVQVVELVQAEENLARKRWDDYPRGLLLQHLAECDEIAVSAANFAVAFLECWDVGATHNLVVGELFSAQVGLGVSHLMVSWEDKRWLRQKSHTSISRKSSGSP